VAPDATRLFCCTHASGHAPQVRQDPHTVQARKRRLIVGVTFAAHDGVIGTPEGDVHMQAGDAIITGPSEERWPGAYESLPLPVLALPMQRPFVVVLPDQISRLHGGAGDWLIDYGDGSLGVVAGALFDTFYECEPAKA
jgi:hypothetical protein